jgi:hypothetical protein
MKHTQEAINERQKLFILKQRSPGFSTYFANANLAILEAIDEGDNERARRIYESVYGWPDNGKTDEDPRHDGRDAEGEEMAFRCPSRDKSQVSKEITSQADSPDTSCDRVC